MLASSMTTQKSPKKTVFFALSHALSSAIQDSIRQAETFERRTTTNDAALNENSKIMKKQKDRTSKITEAMN